METFYPSWQKKGQTQRVVSASLRGRNSETFADVWREKGIRCLREAHYLFVSCGRGILRGGEVRNPRG